MAGIFKAYDIRGIVGETLSEQTPLTNGRAYLIGRALADGVFASQHRASRPIALTRDMRTHGQTLYANLSQGLRDGGCDVLEVGLCATPMNYFAINFYDCAGGVQVTASHNGPEYNGFKVSGPKAAPLDFSTGLDAVEAYVLNAEKNGVPPLADKIGERKTVDNVLEEYLKWMNGFTLAGDKSLKIGIDCGNGMGGLFLPGFFEAFPQFEATPLFWELDGNFPNHEADPLKSENLVDVQKLVRENGLDFGVAFDGDADRCMFVDENGDSISSDLITALIAGEVLKVESGPILYDLRSSQAVPEWITEHGGRPVRGRVGHSFMKRLLKKEGAKFGGELSGHYYFASCFGTDSGLMAMIQIINLLSQSKQPLSAHIAPLRRYYATGEINYRVPDVKAALAEIEAHFAAQNGKLDYLDGLTVEIGEIKDGGWWFNLRSSNTEPLLRLNLEASTPELRDKYLAEVQGILGVEPAQGH